MRRLLLAALFCCLAGWRAEAAIAFDTSVICTAGGTWCVNGASPSPATYNITVGASSTVVLVWVAMYSDVTSTISAVNLDFGLGTNVVCSLVTSVSDSLAAAVQLSSLYKCIGATSGVRQVRIDFTSTATNTFLSTAAASYNGVDTTTPFDTEATGNSAHCGTGTTCSLATTVNGTGEWLVGMAFERFGNLTAGAGTTVRQVMNGGSAAYADSAGTVSSGSQALAYVADVSGTWPGQITAALCPTGGCGAPAAPATKIMFGSPF